jgi:glycerophosphoryl diester phosphodiesterase
MMPLRLGHRGARASTEIQENSLASFDLALEHGCDGFEFDVRKSLDGEAVICHDPKWRGKTISKTGAALLGLPALQDVIRLYSLHAFLDIELKVPGLEDQALAALLAHPPSRGYVISSFLTVVVKRIAVLDAHVQLGIICGNRAQLSAWRDLPVKFVMVEKKLVTPKLVVEMHDAGKRIIVWTVNRASSMERFAEFGVDGIISDDTERLVATLEG